MVVSPRANETDVVGVDAIYTLDQLMPSGGSNPNPLCIDLSSDGERRTIVQKEDVLLGRGNIYHSHPGNVCYRALIKKNRDRYFGSIDPGDKKLITTEILDSVMADGRFLKAEGAKWVVIDREMARLKIAHAFQYCCRRSLQHGDSVPCPQMQGGEPLRQRMSRPEPLNQSYRNSIRFPSFEKNIPPVLPQKAKPATSDPIEHHACRRALSMAYPCHSFPPAWQACVVCQLMSFNSQASTFLELASKFSLVFPHHEIISMTDPQIPADLLRCNQDLKALIAEEAFAVEDDNIVASQSHTNQLDPPLFQATTSSGSLGSFATTTSQPDSIADKFMDW